MSYQIGIDTLHLRGAPRLAHTECCSHQDLKDHVTAAASRQRGRPVSFAEAWDLDLLWRTNDGPVEWEQCGRVTDMGHGEFLKDGSDKREAVRSPFKDVAEVLAFDAVSEYGLPDRQELVECFENDYQRGTLANPEVVFPGGRYKTIISGAIQSFGWDLLLQAAASPSKFEAVLDSFFRLSLHHIEAWAETSIEVFICHDDMVWTQGSFMRPDYCRNVLFPRYKRLWEPLLRKGKIVLFCSDGTLTEFVDDAIEAGADGLILEPANDLEYVVRNYGQSHAIVSSKVDARTLTFGTPAGIRAEIDATWPWRGTVAVLSSPRATIFRAMSPSKTRSSTSTTSAHTGAAATERRDFVALRERFKGSVLTSAVSRL